MSHLALGKLRVTTSSRATWVRFLVVPKKNWSLQYCMICHHFSESISYFQLMTLPYKEFTAVKKGIYLKRIMNHHNANYGAWVSTYDMDDVCMVHSMNFVSVKMHDPPKKFFFAWNWWNTSQWHPITWIWPLECSRKSQFWRSLKWHSLCTVKVASKNCLSGLHFLELWLVSYHFGNLQSRPSKAH